MLKILGDKRRLISSFIVIALTVPAFVLTSYAGEVGRYFGIVVIAIIGGYGLFEVLTSLKIVWPVSLAMACAVVPAVLLGWDDFREIIRSPEAPTSQALRWALQDWKIYVIVAIMTFLPLALDSSYLKVTRNIWINQIIIILVTFTVVLFVKCIWAITVGSFLKFGFIVLIAVLADTFAYLGGMRFGTKWFHGAKFAPRLSPKKTWTGFVCGFVIATTFAVLAGYFGNVWDQKGSPRIVISIVAGFLLPLAAAYGDLAFSAIKRWAGVKDFSNLIPGHGGIFDRFDALAVITVLAAIIFVII